MGVEWQSRDFLTDWTGLYNRLQSVDVPPSYSRTARNVDFYGSAIGKRAGTQIVNGWATLVTQPGWTIIAAGSAQGGVVDASGFQVGDSVGFATQTGGNFTGGTITAIAGNVITVNGLTILPVPGQSIVYARRDFGAECKGLYHAVFRDPTQPELLLAAAGNALWNVWGTQVGSSGSWVPAPLAQHWPLCLISTVGGWGGSTTAGPIDSVETLVCTDHSTAYQPANSSAASPDIIQIVHSGTIIYEGTIASISGTTIHLTGACSVAPVQFDTVYFFPHRTPDDTRFTMLNNRVYVTSAAAKNPVKSGPGAQVPQRQPPTVIESAGGVVYERRMGVRAPTAFPTATVATLPPPGSGNIRQGTYQYRYTYVNTFNGQESEASPESAVLSVGVDFSAAVVAVKASPDPQVGGINIYRTFAGQDGAWYLVNTAGPIANATANYTDNTADAGLGQLLRTFTNECPPDTTTVLAVWTQAGTLVGIDSGSIAEGGEQVIWADAPDIVNGVYKLESWPLNNTLFVNRDDSDHLVGLGVFFDSVVVWKGRSMHRIVGAPPDIILQPISFRDDHTGIGIWSAKGFVMDQDVAIFVSDDGFYQVSRYDGVQQGFTSARISRMIDQEFYLRTSQGLSAQRANRELAHLLYHRVKRRLHAFVPVDGNARATDSFVYQMEGTVDGAPHGWSLWSVPVDYKLPLGIPPASFSYISASCMVNAMLGIDYPYYGTGTGLILKADTGAGDWQQFPVTIASDTVWFSGGGAGVVCRCRAVDFVFIPTAGMPAPILRVGTDFDVPERYQLPMLAALGVPANLNPLILDLGQYLSIGVEETSVTGLFLVEDFTLWFQRLPVGVTPRLIPVQL